MSFCSGTILVNQSRFRFLDRFANYSPKMQPSAKTYNTTLSMQTADAKRNKENRVESSKNISPIRLTESRKTHSEKGEIETSTKTKPLQLQLHKLRGDPYSPTTNLEK